ncbi:replication-relaxation family protein [Caldibacillus lycopersici]|uniref:Replication-relaxation family protein n=1 Tax=Perspicuibacillus lycopersici TaxID=1325689 RepID=A0AAE3IVB9_9BACI|nr:replication-relaxation family protein [Perspicuibacillus lycopersici]MCU9612735.1 replication-relaxation family protein [Perspicuibacillus lycopersici]
MGNELKVVLYKGKNRKRLILKNNDLFFLKILYAEEFLSEMQLYGYYTKILKQKISYPGLWKKLSKFEDYSLVKSYKYRVGQVGTEVKYFKILSKGIEILAEKNLLTMDAENEGKVQVKNYDHFFATKEFILKSFIEFQKYSFPIEDIKVLKGSQTKLFPQIIPDAAIHSGSKTLYLELDTGSESISVLKHKLRIYLENALEILFPDEAIAIILLDNSIPNRKGIEDRSKRIRNIYKELVSIPKFYHTWIDIFILPLRLSNNVIHSFYWQSPWQIQDRIIELSDKLIKSKKLIEISPISKDYYHIFRQKFGIHIDRIVLHNQTKYYKFATVFFYMMPGNIRCINNLERVDNINSASDVKIEVIYAVYPSKKTMIEEIKIYGAIKGVRYIALDEVYDDYECAPHIYVMETKKSVKKMNSVKNWPTLF